MLVGLRFSSARNNSFQNGPILDSNPRRVSASLDQFKACGFTLIAAESAMRQSRNQEEPEERSEELNRKERIGRKKVGAGFKSAQFRELRNLL